MKNKTSHKFKSFPKKSLGQNYLIDENICRNTVNSFDINSDDFVIEIGSGRGEITKYILQKTKNLIAIEIDTDNTSQLREKFAKLNILEYDFLKVDLKKINIPRNKKIRIIGNIPYNITTDILFKLIDNRNLIQDAQLMLQEELAQRIVASPGTKAYGILSIMLQVFCFPKLLFKVSKNCFYPKPKVDSRIVHFDFSKNRVNEINHIEFFKKLIRRSFGTRRKTLRNSLKNLNINSDELNIDFDFSLRAESLTVDELINLSNKLVEILN